VIIGLPRELLVSYLIRLTFYSSLKTAKGLHARGIQQQKFTYDELWELEVQLWDNFLYPANLKQAQTINSTIFTADVRKTNNHQ
jgi:hypothetical protein